MLESEEIKKQLENAYALMFEWSRNPGPGGCLQEMDKFLEGYQKRGAKPTARGDENEVAVDTELKGASPFSGKGAGLDALCGETRRSRQLSKATEGRW